MNGVPPQEAESGDASSPELNWEETVCCWPTSLSDASAPTCDLEEHIKKGLRAFIWYGKGPGWEPRCEQQLMPSLDRIAALIAGRRGLFA